MFQSAGLFRDISCPYFIFGLCERPYCHFKHSKHDEAKGNVEIFVLQQSASKHYCTT